VDLLIAEAREHGMRLVLLWFGTWKNGSGHYMPRWMKAEPEKYPRVIGKDGRRVDSPSPHSKATLEADVRAFSALMRHLRRTDPLHTVILVQVENEPGTWGSVRDYSPAAEALFQAPVPEELLRELGKRESAGSNWPAAFGADADEFFHAWSVARFIGEVAAAGKREYALPLYVNAALRDPLRPPPPPSYYESGGPTDNVLSIYKAAAPMVDLLAPDIYLSDGVRHRKVIELYARDDNALFVPETGTAPEFARYCFVALGAGAIGWAPFGVDYVAVANEPIGAPRHNEQTLAQFALNYRTVGPMMRELAKLSFEGKLHAAAEEPSEPRQFIDLGRWHAVVSYGVKPFGPEREPRGNPEPVGRVLVGELGPEEFLVAGLFCRVHFSASDAESGAQREYVRVEEGTFENGVFRPIRIWNGDQTDWGLNFRSVPQILRVVLGTY
jgi:beta-galactosidase GanA